MLVVSNLLQPISFLSLCRFATQVRPGLQVASVDVARSDGFYGMVDLRM